MQRASSWAAPPRREMIAAHCCADCRSVMMVQRTRSCNQSRTGLAVSLPGDHDGGMRWLPRSAPLSLWPPGIMLTRIPMKALP
eukprot:12611037-Heterocapsa_arctica.AAC.1